MRRDYQTLFLALLFVCLPASATYRCEGAAGTAYSDQPCQPAEASRKLEPSTATDESAARAAASRAARQRAQVQRLQAERERRLAAEESARIRAQAGKQAHEKHCKLLEMKKRWSEEDAGRASLRHEERAKRALRRKAEQYELECVAR